MKVQVDKDLCIGCGLCTSLCGNVFSIDSDGKASVISEIDSSSEESVNDACGSCPVNAIHKED